MQVSLWLLNRRRTGDREEGEAAEMPAVTGFLAAAAVSGKAPGVADATAADAASGPGAHTLPLLDGALLSHESCL